MERVVLRPYWRESLNIAASITSMSNANPCPYILTNGNLFQHNAEVSTGCPNDAALFKSVEKPHPESPEIPESLSTNHLQNQWEWRWIFQFPNEVGRYLLIWARVGLFNRFTHCSISLGQHIDTSALGWNKLQFVKMQGYGFDIVDVCSTYVDAAMNRDSLQ